ncbi:MAG: nucleotidyltransferase [Clostridia bacterium]|nr:nucleotidyltransferase [Clostridia bacterium]
MGRVLGIIAEYNPFHNGHLYHLEKSLDETNCDYSVALITGSFAQRGQTSIVDKWHKAEMAINNGIDLVLELPTIYGISSAENFAEGAIKIFDSLKLVDTLSFGVETTNTSALNAIANVLYEEPKEYLSILKHELQKGLSFPKARENAVLMYLKGSRGFSNILNNPNNILAIEYLKALRKYKSHIIPTCITRNSVGYNDKNITGSFASATAIRDLIEKNKISDIRKVIPDNSFNILYQQMQNGQVVTSIKKFEKEIIYTLRKMSLEEIANLADVSEGLEFLIKKAANSCNTLNEFMNIVKTKRYTQTRLQRILIYALLGITKTDIKNSYRNYPYVRVLGFNSKGKYLLSEICRINPYLPIITSVKKFMDTNKNKYLRNMLEKDILATNIYTLGYEYDSWSNLDYTNKLIIK